MDVEVLNAHVAAVGCVVVFGIMWRPLQMGPCSGTLMGPCVAAVAEKLDGRLQRGHHKTGKDVLPLPLDNYLVCIHPTLSHLNCEAA